MGNQFFLFISHNYSQDTFISFILAFQERAVKQFGCADAEYGRMLRERINYYKNDKGL